MAEETQPGLPPEFPPTPPHPFSAVLFNERGLRSGWRIAIYLFAILLFSYGIDVIFASVLHLPKTDNPSPQRLLLLQALSFAILLLGAWCMSVLERRPFGDYGLPVRSLLGVRFWHGCLAGVVHVCVLVGLVWLFRGYSFGSLDLSGTAILRWAALWALVFLFVGLTEEFAFRGYLLFTLADGIGFWPAASIISLGFGAAHLRNPGESPVGVLAVVAIAFVFALSLRRTGDLWLAVGWHAAFDFGETFLFSVPNSGNLFEGHLSSATLHGPAWLTGGTAGPEGSLFSFVTIALAALYIHKVFPAKPKAASKQGSSAALPVA